MNSTRKHLPGADGKIVFDPFHIAKHLSEAVDQVRRKENKQLRAAGDDRLAGTRYDWLRHPGKMEPDDRKEFAVLRDSNLKTARAWALKEAMMAFVTYLYERPARKHYRWWHNWAVRSRLKPVIEKARNDPAALRQHRYLHPAPDHQRSQRIDQLTGAMGQVHRTGVPQHQKLRHRNLLPLRRTRSYALDPLKTRNAQEMKSGTFVH